jgi:hypothetical protein
MGPGGALRVVAVANMLPHRGAVDAGMPTRVWDLPVELMSVDEEVAGAAVATADNSGGGGGAQGAQGGEGQGGAAAEQLPPGSTWGDRRAIPAGAPGRSWGAPGNGGAQTPGGAAAR